MPHTPLGPGPLIYAHRGDRSRAADNTIEAFTLAVDAGAHGIELDVRRTADGVLVLSHDPAIGDLPPVFRMTHDELRAAAPTVPTLRDALAHIPPHVFVNVEVKNAIHEPDFDASRSIVEQAIDIVLRHDDPSRILLSSFDPEAVRTSRSRSSVLRGLLITKGIPLDAAISLAVELEVDAIHPPLATIDGDPAAAVASATRVGLATVVWDANTPAGVASAANGGADVIITDDPAMGRSVIA